MNKQKRYTPSISLKEDQRDWIKKQAEKNGISYTHYMRKVVLGALPQAKDPFYEKDQPIPIKEGMSYRELHQLLAVDLARRIGNNLNQIARKLNEGVPADDKMVEQMKDIRKEMNRIVRKLIKILR